MARRPTSTPEEPQLNAHQLQNRIERLERCINDLEAFDPSSINSRGGDPGVQSLEAAIEDALSAAFGHGTPTYNRYRGAAELDQGPHIMRPGDAFGRGPRIDYDARDREEARRYVSEGLPRSIALLRTAIRSLRDQLDEQVQIAAPAAIPERAAPSGRRVFVVHGHDTAARESVARFLTSIGFEPIILHEQANRGRTVIEKVEAHGDVGFAVVLLTPDDLGRAASDTELEPRARQNVLLELGYFIARLGRANVCTLMRGEVRVPSDFAGVVWEIMDEAGGWRQSLGRELQAAGYLIDWNLLMR